MPNYKHDHEFDTILNMTDVQRAYLAGMIDADGTITFSTAKIGVDGSRRVPGPMVLVVNTNFELIEWLKDTIGYGCAYYTKTTMERAGQDRRNWRPVHRFQITGRAALAVLDAVHEYLIVKKELSALVKGCPVKGRGYHYRPSEAQLADALRRYDEVRHLNRRIKT